ncbi:hypothetical protein PQX77_001084, partial [Marasmius sp. AFHP31]
MSSDKPPVRRKSRSSGKSASSRTQPSRRSTPDESQSPPENVDLSAGPVLKEIAGPDERQRDPGTPKQDPTSIKERVFPHAKDKDEGKDELNTDTRPGEQTPLDGTKTDNRAGNEDNAQKVSNPQEPTLEKSWEVIMEEVTSLDEGLVGGWKDDIDT